MCLTHKPVILTCWCFNVFNTCTCGINTTFSTVLKILHLSVATCNCKGLGVFNKLHTTSTNLGCKLGCQ